MKFKKIIMLICISVCILFTISCAFANEVTNETDLQAEVLQVNSNEINDTIYFNASASNDGNGSEENPYKYFKSDRISYGSTAYFADGIYDITEANSIYSSSTYKTTFIGQSVDNTIFRSSLSNRFEFTVTTNSYFVLKDLTMVDIHINNQANLIADNVVFRDTVGFNPEYAPSLSYSYISKAYDSSYGGVIICDTPSNKKTTLNLTNCNFTNNLALSGGVIAAYNTIANIQNCVFYDSRASEFGGAIYSIKSNFNIEKSSFELSYAKYGGVIYSNSTELNLKDSQFLKSWADSFGGIIAAFSGKLDANNVIFNNYKSVTDAGGAIYSTGLTLNVVDSSFTDGFSDFGGAICNLKTNSTITNTKFINNRAQYYGGSIYNMYGTLVLSKNTFNKSQAETGGSIFNRFSDSLELKSNQFIDSKADEGPIVFIDGENVKATESGNTYDKSYALFVHGNVYITDYYESVPVIKFSPESIEVIPTSYDSRKYGYITPVKNQIQGGNCWAFSGIATLEACLKKATGIAYDFSEENVKNLMAEFSLFDLDSGANNGGNLYMFIAYLASWFGPIYDENDVYDDHSAISKIYDSLIHVQNVCILPERQNFYDNDEIKKAVLKYGAVSIGIDLSATNGHAVTIVGWDDEFTSSDFLGNKALGAWIIKNSWGSDWGYNGFGYLSYQQPISYGYTFIFDDDREYSNIYQYDFAGKGTYYYHLPGDVVYLKNKFTAENDEILSAFSTYFDEPTNFTAYVYLNGNLVTSQDGCFDYRGYYTVPFDKEVTLKKGDTFEIAIKISNEAPVYFSICTAKDVDKIISGKGISFFSTSGTSWTDFYNSQIPGVACIKAFTRSKSLNEISIDLDQSGGTSDFSSINVDDVVNIQLDLPKYYVVDGVNHPVDGLVTFTVNGQSYFATVENGKAILNISFDKEGTYDVLAQFKSSRVTSNIVKFQVNVVKAPQTDLVIRASDVSKFYGGSGNYVATLTNDGKALSGVNVRILVNGEEYTVVKSDANGQVILDLDLPVGTYQVSAAYGGKEFTSKFTILSTIVASDISQEYGCSEISASFLNTDGNALINENVVFNIDLYGLNVNYNTKLDATTNAAGTASSEVSLPVSKYKVSVLNPVSGEKKEFMLDITPVDTSCLISVTQSGSKIILNAIINTDATLTSLISFDQSKPYINFIVGDKVYKANVSFTRINAENRIVGLASCELNGLSNGDYTVSAIFSGNSNFKVSSSTKEFSVVQNPYKLSSGNYLGYYGNAATMVVITDSNNKPVNGKVVYATIGDKKYTATTNENGQAIFRPDLEVGDYIVLFEYEGQSIMQYFFVHSTIDMDELSGQYLDSKVGATFSYYSNNQLKAVVNEKVTFIVNGTEYYAVTDEYGYASVDVDLPVGTHTVTAINPHTKEKKQSKMTIFKTTPTITISKSKRGDSVFITASFSHTSAVGNVVFTMGSNKYVSIIENGKAVLALIVLDEGSYNVYANYIGDPNFNNILSSPLDFTYEHTNYTITAPQITKYYNGSEKFTVTLTDFNKPVSGEFVTITIDDKDYNIKTDSKGVATFNEKLNPGTYTVYCSYEDKSALSEITVKPTVIVTSSTIGVSNSKLSVEFLDSNGNLIKNKAVKFKVNNKEYTQTTDNWGIATFEPALNKGEYTVSVINPVTGETKNTKLVITKSTPTLTLSVVQKDEVNVLKAALPKDASGVVEFVFDSGELFEIDLVKGECILEGIDPGEYNVVATYKGNDAYNSVSKSTKFTVNRIASVLKASQVTTTYGTSKKLVVTLKDTRGNILVGSEITVNLNKKVYSGVISTAGDAEITVPSSLGAKTYYATITFVGENNIDGDSIKVKVVVKKATPKVTAAKKTFKVKDKTKKYVVTLKTNKNKVYKKQKITIKVKGKTYKATTNSKGQATFKLTKLTKKGTFTAVVTYSGNSNFNKVTKKVKITVK